MTVYIHWDPLCMCLCSKSPNVWKFPDSAWVDIWCTLSLGLSVLRWPSLCYALALRVSGTESWLGSHGDVPTGFALGV